MRLHGSPARHPPDDSHPVGSGEGGFTLIEVLVATVVLVVGLLGLFGMLSVAARTTMTNRQRQAATSLAREVLEDARTLAYTQLTPTALPAALQPLIAGSTVAGQGLTVTRSVYPLDVSLTVCSLDDPTDGYGNHSSPPASGGSWCPDQTGSGTTDTNPDDEKRLSVIVTPHSGGQAARVQLSTLIQNQQTNGPAVSCLTTSQSACPGTNQTVTTPSTSSLTFFATTTGPASSVRWLVNGNPPPNAQIPSGATDPYVPSGTSSQFTWTLPQADGTYTISAAAQDSAGDTGSGSTLQITVNRHQAAAPASTIAGYDRLIGGVDVQWPPSTDQDILYYNVYHQVGGGSKSLVCGQVKGTSCTDLTAPNPGTPSAPCTLPLTDLGGQANDYWVVGVDTDPATGQPRESTQSSPPADANLCDNAPSPPTGLTAAAANGTVTLNWTAPPAPGDVDPGDSIEAWRVYRWTSGGAVDYRSDRIAYVGAVNGGQAVTSFTDDSADPGGVAQNYCVTSVDTHLNESPCSNVVGG